ncbi:branched chain amino acid aminotransferase [Pasteurellaceae bacterium Macca]|nr:branched chain amino acid aminotransferase [Pasteurellaceae bacterium Macca]
MTKNIDWQNLGFSYIKTDYRFVARWKDGSWNEGELSTDHMITLHEGSTALHYAQQCFEGLKAYRCKDGSVNLFRPDQNAERLQKTCARLLIPAVPVNLFIRACKEVVKANQEWLAPYGTGATLYLRPFIIGVGENIGIRPAPEYIFTVFCCPVGSYFKGGMKPSNFLVSEYDRAAPNGTGGVKVGGNYAASILPHEQAAERNFADAIYLDPKTHTKIEEVGAANFFGITKDNKFITPDSPSILPSITKYSLLYLAKERLGLEAIEGDVYIDQLDQFAEAGACGTAAVISPIGGIQHGDNFHVFYSETEVGPITQRLYQELTGIQFGDIEAPEGWITKVELD